jgi:hypothetical protein
MEDGLCFRVGQLRNTEREDRQLAQSNKSKFRMQDWERVVE